MSDCPVCGSANIEKGPVDVEDRQDDEHTVEVTPCKCLDCKATFDSVERWTVEIENVHHAPTCTCEECAEERRA